VRLQLPLSGPAALTASLVPGGEGVARLAPLYTDAGFVPQAWAAGATAVKLAGQPVVSCPDANPCEIVYELTTGYPAGELALTWFPRLFSDPAGHNEAVAEVSVNDGPWRPVDAFGSSGSGRWEGLGVTRRASVDLGGKTGSVRLRFRLTGDGAQLWSAPETPLTATLTLDARSLPALALPPGETPLTLEFGGE
jgi:hypothetical protein